jgi:hypothetical protein
VKAQAFALFLLVMKMGWENLPQITNPDGTLKHTRKEGSRKHVVTYSTQGRHCSEPNCEINKKATEAGKGYTGDL